MKKSTIKRALQKLNYSREWSKPEGCDEAVPRRVLDPEGKPVADTWAQAAALASSGKPGNPFKHSARRKAFDQAITALRKLFPNAKESFIRAEARGKARQVAVKKKPKPPKVPVNVAQTYRAPTRAERAGSHREKMLRKAGRRHGHPNMLPEPLANLSRNHPDYGCSPVEHAQRKAGRG